MIACLRKLFAKSRAPAGLAVLALFLSAIADAASCQTAAPQPSLGLQEQGSPPQPPQAGSPAQNAAPAGRENPGLINEMGKLFDRIAPSIKSPGEALEDFNARARNAAKDAGDALSRLTSTGAMVTGRVICPVAANGTPDCKLGADELCQGKGFKEGKSLNTDAAQTCSARVLIPGRARKPDDCRTDDYVTTALCQ